MEPLKPTEKKSILENSPSADPRELEEYDRLLSMRFTSDPDHGPAFAPAESFERGLPSSEDRIAELHAKLFGKEKAAAAAAGSNR